MHDDLRNSILTTARHLLVQHGYAAVSMRKIAETVGCSASSIYLYFENKDALVHALIDEGFQRWYEVVERRAAAPGEPLQRLESHSREYVAWGLENPEYYEIMYMFHPERMARYPKELYRRATRSMDLLTEMVRACAPSSFPTKADARMAAHVHWAILHGVVSTIIAGRLDRRLDRTEYIEVSVRAAVAVVAQAPTLVG